MLDKLRDPAFLPSCIFAGIGFLFVVLAAALPPGQVLALAGGTAFVVGLVLARLRRDVTETGAMKRPTKG